jgi:hypothetical protein
MRRGRKTFHMAQGLGLFKTGIQDSTLPRARMLESQVILPAFISLTHREVTLDSMN